LFSDIPGSPAERIAQTAQRGAPYQMSVGLFNYSEEFISSGQHVKVHGKEHTGPLTVLRRGTVRECSIVALGADSATSARLFGRDARQPVGGLSARAIYAARRRAAELS
jgi:hypothetical protein